MTSPGVKILVVDDEPPIRKLLRVGLGGEGYTTVEAGNAAAALDQARAEQPDLILLDLGLPGCNGIDSLMRFREAYPEGRIVVVSTVDDVATIRSALAAGAAGYIPKSGNVRLLMGALRLVAEGGTYIPPQALADVLGQVPARDRASGE